MKNSSDTPCPPCASRLRAASSTAPGKQLNHLPNLGVPSLTHHVSRHLSGWVSRPRPGPRTHLRSSSTSCSSPVSLSFMRTFFIPACPVGPITSHCVARLNHSTFPLAPHNIFVAMIDLPRRADAPAHLPNRRRDFTSGPQPARQRCAKIKQSFSSKVSKKMFWICARAKDEGSLRLTEYGQEGLSGIGYKARGYKAVRDEQQKERIHTDVYREGVRVKGSFVR